MDEEVAPPSFAGNLTGSSTNPKASSASTGNRTDLQENQQQATAEATGTGNSPNSEAEGSTTENQSPADKEATEQGTGGMGPDFLAPDTPSSPDRSPQEAATMADLIATTAGGPPVPTPRRRFRPTQTCMDGIHALMGTTAAPPPPPAVAIAATAKHIPPPPLRAPPQAQTPAEREAELEAAKTFEALEYAFGHPPQPLAGEPGTYAVRDPSSGRLCLWRNSSATDQDTLNDMADRAEDATEPRSKRKQRCDEDSWQNAILTVKAVYPPTGATIDVSEVPINRTGEYTYRVAAAVMGSAATLQPKSSSAISGRDISRQSLLVLYTTCPNRFDRQSTEWMDSWSKRKLERESCIAYLAGRCNNPNCRRVHISWSGSEISGEQGTDATRFYNDREAPRLEGPMSPMDEPRPRGDGLAVADLMGPATTDASIDTVHRHVLQQFRRGSDSTPRRDNRSAVANPQPNRESIYSAAQAATDLESIGNLAAASSTWNIVQRAIATGADIDVQQQQPSQSEIDANATALEQLLRRTAAAVAQK